MNPRLLELLETVEKLAEAGRVQSARGISDGVLIMELDPEARALALYDLAVFSWDYLADGLKARELFDQVIQHYQAHPELKADARAGKFLAYACENRMLLSLSYDEYDEWAGELRPLSPDEAILQGQVPVVHETRNAGMPWSDILQMIARSHYDRNDPKLDAGMYGRAAGTYQLLLENRRTLRLNREDWSRVLYEYGALMEKLSMVSTRAMEEAGHVYPDEFRFYLDLARTRIDEFVQSNQPTDTITFISNSVNEMLEMASQGERGLAPMEVPHPAGVHPLPDPGRPRLVMSCLTTLIVIGIFAFVVGKSLGWW